MSKEEDVLIWEGTAAELVDEACEEDFDGCFMDAINFSMRDLPKGEYQIIITKKEGA